MLANIRNTRIYFDVDGAGLRLQGAMLVERRTAFIVHGGPGVDHTGLKGRYGGLSAKMQLVYFDHRGQGRSARGDPRDYTLDENVEDMEALRCYLGLEQIVSIGTSYGGMVAMAHAARYPTAVSHLVLIATASHAGCFVRGAEILRERGSTQQIAQFNELLAGRINSEEKLRDYFRILGPLYALGHDPVLSDTGLERAILSPDAVNQAMAPDGFLRSFDLRPELGRIVAPTLIIAGRHDWICSPEFAEEMHGLIRHSDLRIFERSAHAIGGDEPVPLMDAVSGFIVYNAGRW